MSGIIRFGEMTLPVYYDGNEDTPIFKLKDLGVKVSRLDKLEEDEWFKGLDGEIYVNELGLYNLLSFMNNRSARLWRRVIHSQLIQMRKDAGKNIEDQFDDWQEMANDYYFDEETGKLMKSVTVEGGDVEQVPAEEG